MRRQQVVILFPVLCFFSLISFQKYGFLPATVSLVSIEAEVATQHASRSAIGVDLPSWMTDYLTWHTEQRTQLTPDNWNTTTFRFLILRCLHKDNRCGGSSDRLKSIPFFIRLAHQYQRILLITWERPAPLEAFLVPPSVNAQRPVILNWTLPIWMQPDFPEKPTVMKHKNFDFFLNNTNRIVVDMRHQRTDLAMYYYNKHRLSPDEPRFEHVYRHIWNRVFVPSEPVQSLLLRTKERLQLRDTSYNGVHIRSLYKRNATTDGQLSHQAAYCASTLPSSMSRPTLVVSDSTVMARSVVAQGDKNHSFVWDNSPNRREPKHLDTGTTFLNRDDRDTDQLSPVDFYSVFVDLYLLAGAQCIAYNVGGFGSWASLIGEATGSSCWINYAKTVCPEWGQSSSNKNITDV